VHKFLTVSRDCRHQIVEELAGLGARVHTCSRNDQELNDRVQEWKGRGFQVSGSVCDLSSSSDRQRLMETVSSQYGGKLNILVNNAAAIVMKSCVDHTWEDYASVVGTNLESPYHLCQLGHPLLKASENGNRAINQLTRSLACEWATDNIRTNTVAPGGVRTSFTKPV
ncbi:Tropinone reductase 1, partial [Linum grandiflorum]